MRAQNIPQQPVRGGIRAAGAAQAVRQEAGSEGGEAGPAALDPWPLPNISLGVAVESQDRAGRIGELLQTPANLRWVCFEPLLGPVQPDLVPVADGGYADALRGGRFDIDWRGRRLGSAEPMLRPLDWVVAGGETGAGARPTDLVWVQDLRDRCTAAGVPSFSNNGENGRRYPTAVSRGTSYVADTAPQAG